MSPVNALLQSRFFITFVETNPEILRLGIISWILSREALLETIYMTKCKKCLTEKNSKTVKDAMLIMPGIGDEEKN